MANRRPVASLGRAAVAWGGASLRRELYLGSEKLHPSPRRGQAGFIEALRAAVAERRALELRIGGCPLADLTWATPTADSRQFEPDSNLAATSPEPVEVREAPHQAVGEVREAAVFGSIFAPGDLVGALDNLANCV